MRILFVILLTTIVSFSSFAQNEQAPIIEKPLAYKDWTYKTVDGDKDLNLRKSIAGKKLVIVVYWAPWCPNWRYDAPFVQSIYEKYKANGLEVIGVAEYDTVDKIKAHIKDQKLTFPIVYESVATADREKTAHFAIRRQAGDVRKWGSPWYIILEPSKLESQGDVLANNVGLVNGELARVDAENLIRQKLGLGPAASAAGLANAKEIEACEPDKTAARLKP